MMREALITMYLSLHIYIYIYIYTPISGFGKTIPTRIYFACVQLFSHRCIHAVCSFKGVIARTKKPCVYTQNQKSRMHLNSTQTAKKPASPADRLRQLI